MRWLAISLALTLGCAAAPDDAQDPLAPEHTTQAIPAVDRELVGLHVNANTEGQHPAPDALCELSPAWIRSVVYKGRHAQTLETLHRYRMKGAKTLLLVNSEAFETPLPSSPFFPEEGSETCRFDRDVAGDELAKFEEAIAAYGDEFGKLASEMLLVYGDTYDALEVFNEPDGIAGGCLRARDYAAILARAIPHIRSDAGLFGRPVTLGAIVAPDWRSYMKEVVDTLATTNVEYDGFSFHPYAHRVSDDKGICPAAWEGLGDMRWDLTGGDSVYEIANRHPRDDGKKRQVWITEFGFPLEADEPGCDQAEYLTRSFRVFDSARDGDGERVVAHAFWFAFNDANHYDDKSTFGLVDKNGAIRPAGRAFANLLRSYPECPLSCRTPSKCSNDAPPNEIDTAACDAALADATCGTFAHNLMECVAANQQCRPDAYTDAELAKWACEREKNDLAACRGG
jgi:hypothetical protein